MLPKFVARSLLIVAVAVALAQAQARVGEVIFISALCSEEQTAGIVSRAVTRFAGERGWRQTSPGCADLGGAVSRESAPSKSLVVLTSYSAIKSANQLRLLNPHLIAYPTYLMAASPEALRSTKLVVGYVREVIDQPRMAAALEAALGRSMEGGSLEVRIVQDFDRLLRALVGGEVQAMAIVGDDPGASLSRAMQFFEIKSVTPFVLLLQVDGTAIGQVQPAHRGDAQYLFWNWATRPLRPSVQVRTAGGTAFLEVVRSFPVPKPRNPAPAPVGGDSGGGRTNTAKSAGEVVAPTTINDLPVLLSSSGAIVESDRAELGRVLSAAYLQAAFAGPKLASDGCGRDYSESPSAAYLFNAVVENQSDPGASCALWAHYLLTAPTAQRRANKLNADWMSSIQGQACQLAIQSLRPAPLEACPVPSVSIQERAQYRYGVQKLREALGTTGDDPTPLFSQAFSCLVAAVKTRDEPTCRDPRAYGETEPYEPYLPLAVAASGLQDRSRSPVRR